MLVRFRLCLIGTGLACLLGCASTETSRNTPIVWEPSPQWWANAIVGKAYLRRPDGTRVTLSPVAAQSLLKAKQRMASSERLDYDFALADIASPNAYALMANGRPKVILGLSLVSLLQRDPEALEFIIAHEMAHHTLGHVKNNQRAEREQTYRDAGMVLGNLSNLVVPFSGLLINQAVIGYGRGFSRDEERAADAQAMNWLSSQSTSPCGAWRLTRMLEGMPGSTQLGFLSTHPSPGERAEAILGLAKSAGIDCQAAAVEPQR